MGAKSGRKDDLSKQLEIVKVFDLFKEELKNLFPKEGVNLISLKNKTLKVQVSSSSYASELRLHEKDIIKKINDIFGKQVITRTVYRF